MENSILKSVKDNLGVDKEDTVFDGELLTAINTAFFTLYQIGVGPDRPFVVNGNDECWDDFLNNIDELAMVKSYISLKTRLLFDPPTSSSLVSTINEQLAEYEWRLNVESDTS